ncbi:hypothetical protein G6011_09611 [Alternaria panax]|uniref:Thioredoxin domain-containing protein n=1 Tax=Alternaria panax TaxID=48097 RepID=A0AAD4FAS1_9PLEO|nr:hypothetical protein G6011_09611 [Alternaria panax]
MFSSLGTKIALRKAGLGNVKLPKTDDLFGSGNTKKGNTNGADGGDTGFANPFANVQWGVPKALQSWTTPPPPQNPVRKPPNIGDRAQAHAKLQFPTADGRPTILLFLRFCGCPFTEKLFLSLRTLANRHASIHFVAVSHCTPAATTEWLKKLGGAWNVDVVVDQDRELYALWGLGIATWGHVLHPRNGYNQVMLRKNEGVWGQQLPVPDEKESYDGFEVTDSEGHRYGGKKIILATGSKDILPDLEGFEENWPAHIYQCLACGGHEQRGSAVGILGFDNPKYTHFVQMAMPLEPTSITIFSNGPIKEEASAQDALKLAHTDGVTIHFEAGEPVTLGFAVHKPATVNRAQHLIEQLDVETVEPAMGGHIEIANAMFNETSVGAVFAAGDTMIMMKQVAIAMAEGLRAAAGTGMQIAQEKAKTLSKTFEEKEGTVEGEKDKSEVASC